MNVTIEMPIRFIYASTYIVSIAVSAFVESEIHVRQAMHKSCDAFTFHIS
jgi:hypothetical protein